MRKIVVFGLLLACVAVSGWAQGNKEQKSETLLRWHFAGTKQIVANKDLKVLAEMLSVPEAALLREAAATHFGSRAAARFSGGNTNANAELIRLIAPLLPDLWQSESSFEMTAKGAQDADWILAVKLDPAQTGQWNKRVADLAKNAGMQGADSANKSWTVQKENYRLAFSQAKDWTVLEGGFGTPDPKIARDFHSKLEKSRGKELLTGEVNSPLLGKIWKAERLAHAPKLSVRAEPRGDGIRTEMQVEYPEDLGIKPEKWNVPVELISEPLIGFTAIQGVEKKLASLEKVKALGAADIPNQVFFWSQGDTPFSVKFAAEVKNPAQAVSNAARILGEAKLPAGTVQPLTNRPALLWEGIPIVKPYLQVAEQNRSFLEGGLFPVRARTNQPPPKELFAQLKEKNLIYYQWEITGPQLKQASPIWQLYHLVRNEPPANSSASSRWLTNAFTRVGNTITQATLENPRRIKIIRQSQLGLNALELLLLAHWIDDADIMTPRAEKGRRNPVAPPSSPRRNAETRR